MGRLLLSAGGLIAVRNLELMSLAVFSLRRGTNAVTLIDSFVEL